MEFKQLGISTPILRVLQEELYQVPTPIQEMTIPSALAKRDILGLAQTGTGKTAAFAVPTLQLLADRKQSGGKHRIRALILTPTRELALQIYESFTTYGRYLPLKSTVIFGGVGQGKQVNALKAGVDILVATPGRLIDLMNQGYIDISAIEFFILDEADRMLDMGFIHDVRRIIKSLPVKKQTMLFSATMPNGLEGIIEKLLVNPVEVSITPVSSTVDLIEQSVYFVDQIHKVDILIDILKEHKKEPTLIFTRTKGGVDKVVKNLNRKNIKALGIHGGKSQNARQTALGSFKNGEITALVATDIASRGIDINELQYVINYDLPEVPETYVHRIGRTGRAGKEGIAISLCNYQEQPLLKDIEKLIKKNIPVMDNEKYPMIDTTEKEKKQQKRNPQRNTAEKNAAQRSTARKSVPQKGTAQKGTAQNSTTQKGTAQDSTRQDSTRQKGKVQKSTIHKNSTQNSITHNSAATKNTTQESAPRKSKIQKSVTQNSTAGRQEKETANKKIVNKKTVDNKIPSKNHGDNRTQNRKSKY